MTKKDFVLSIVEELKENPRSVLAGHRINSAVLQAIIERPDVMSKLATVLYSLKTRKKGAKGLKKSNVFKISGYKNFPTFNATAREDVEEFVAGLSEKDAASFTNSDNILTIMMLPQGKNDQENSTETDIISGKSVALTFDASVRKEYKIPGGIYITIMFGESAILTVEEKLADRKSKVNKKKQSRRTPAKVKKELKAKANKKLAILKNKKASLDEVARRTAAELEQFNDLSGELGAKQGSARSTIARLKSADINKANVNTAIAGLDADGKAAFKYAMKAMKAGDKRKMNMWLREIEDQTVVDYVRSGAVGGSDEIIASRKAKLRGEVNRLTNRNSELLELIEVETDAKKKLSLKSMLSKNTSKIKQLRDRMGTYKNLSIAAVNNKAAMLAETHAAIEENIAMGSTISEALTDALAALDAKDAEKEIIKQQVIEQVADGMPMQYAVQQAIQQNIQTPSNNSSLSGVSDIEDLLSKI